MKKFIYPLFSLLILSSCDTSVGQSGKYVDFKGKATITPVSYTHLTLPTTPYV